MRDFRDAKAMAKSLRQGLSDKNIEIGHSESLELIAKAFGCDNWNIMAARIEAAAPRVEPAAAPGADGTLYCGFCGKSEHEVAKLIAGPPPSRICDECVAMCSNVLEEPELEACLASDEASGDPAWPALTAYMQRKPEAQLRAYIAAGDRYLAALRKGLGLARTWTEGARRAGADMAPLAERFAAMSLEEVREEMRTMERRLRLTERGLEAAQRAIAEREAV